ICLTIALQFDVVKGSADIFVQAWDRDLPALAHPDEERRPVLPPDPTVKSGLTDVQPLGSVGNRDDVRHASARPSCARVFSPTTLQRCRRNFPSEHVGIQAISLAVNSTTRTRIPS